MNPEQRKKYMKDYMKARTKYWRMIDEIIDGTTGKGDSFLEPITDGNIYSSKIEVND